MGKVILKKGRERPIQNRHHWIFSGAIDKADTCEDGDIMDVFDYSGRFLGKAYFNHKTDIAGRMITFEDIDPLDAILQNIKNAFALRKRLLDFTITNAYRLINGEADLIPGLVVDVYKDVLVVQISTIGIEKLKDKLIKILVKLYKPKAIFERSSSSARFKEGLEPFEGLLYGEKVSTIEVKENGIKFLVDIANSQKSGLYLDHRETRNYVKRIAKGCNVLNCFSYTGGFSLYAIKGGAKHVTSVEISKDATEQAKKNFLANGIDPKKHEFIVQDVFDYLNNNSLDKFDIIILDPPAFAKKKADIERASNAYITINRIALEKMKKASILITSSCSYHISNLHFEEILYRAALRSGRTIRIIGEHLLASDHPINIYQLETRYLKTKVLYVE